jgi:hypothetical protein
MKAPNSLEQREEPHLTYRLDGHLPEYGKEQIDIDISYRMNHEQQPRPEATPLTIEQVASLAKEVLLRDGYHVPMVIARR